TNATTKTTSDSVGHYAFPAVDPSDYSLSMTASGFQTTLVPDFHVEVGKSYSFNMALKVGRAAETVEVTDVATAELQTTNSTVGAVLGGIALENLPVFTR